MSVTEMIVALMIIFYCSEKRIVKINFSFTAFYNDCLHQKTNQVANFDSFFVKSRALSFLSSQCRNKPFILKFL